MKYTKYSTYSYNLHVIKTDKFKTVNVSVNFKRKLDKVEITYRNMLVNMICTSTKEYPTKRLLDMACEDLYALKYNATNYISGCYNVLGINIKFLNEKYTEAGYLEKSIKFLSDLIFKPNIEKKRNIISFKQENFDIAYNHLTNCLETLKEDTSRYARVRMLENMEPNSYISYNPMGYIEDLKKVTPKNLYEYYENMLNSDIIDIFVVGDVNASQVRKAVEKSFVNFKTLKKPSESHFIEPKSKRLVPKTIKEQKDISQSKLCIGFKIDHMTDFEKRYVLNVYSYILGGSPNSKLFKEVREKNSLCYSIGASANPLTSTMIIGAGINKEDFKKTITLIKKQLNDMKKGNFEDSNVIEAKITYINTIKEIEDSPIRIINLYQGIEYLNSHTIEERFLRINRVGKKDIIRLANKIHMDTIYLLEGEKHD